MLSVAMRLVLSVIFLTLAARVAYAVPNENECAALSGIYLQEDPVTKAYKSGQLGALVSARGTHRPSEVELNLVKPLSLKQWKAIWTSVGLSPKQDNVIIDFWHGDTWFAPFQKTVTAGRAVGLTIVAPIFSPNWDKLPLDSFATNPRYALIRKAALLGGGLVLDPPPAYFFQRGAPYQTFAYDEIHWAKQHGLRTTVIISPYGDDNNLLSNVRKYVSMFVQHDALPSEWALENYVSSDGNDVSCVGAPNSLPGVATWLAQNGPAGSSHGGESGKRRTRSGSPALIVFQGIPSHS